MLLNEDEKQRFIEWLKLTAETCNGMAIEMERLQGTVMEGLAKREKIKAVSCLLIANDLKNTETMTIDTH